MALSKELKNFVKDTADGRLDGPHISDRSGLEAMGLLMNHMEAAASLIQWTGTTAEGTNGDTANNIALANGSAVESDLELSLTDTVNQTYDLAANDYTLDITASGSAANQEYSTDDGTTWTAFSGATEFTLTDGASAFKVRADYSSNTMVLTLSNASGSKDLDGTLTITGS